MVDLQGCALFVSVIDTTNMLHLSNQRFTHDSRYSYFRLEPKGALAASGRSSLVPAIPANALPVCLRGSGGALAFPSAVFPAALVAGITLGMPSAGLTRKTALGREPSVSRLASLGQMHHFCNPIRIAAPSSPTANLQSTNLGIRSLLNGPLNA